MPLEKSAGAVVFRIENNIVYYLLLHYPSSAKSAKDYWGFPKGHIEKGETPLMAAQREIKEETGLDDIRFLKGFREWIKYYFLLNGRKIFKIVTFFLAGTNTSEIEISGEHIGYQWLTYERASQRLRFANDKEILKKAQQFLQRRLIQKKGGRNQHRERIFFLSKIGYNKK